MQRLPMSKRRCYRRAFTLIEMIGVLAVMAILASLLIPKIFEAMNNARVSEVQVTCQTIKTAALEHYGKFLSFASSNGTPLTIFPGGSYDTFDTLLLSEGLTDKPFAPRISETALIRIRNVSTYTVSTSLYSPDGFSAYDLDGDTHNDII